MSALGPEWHLSQEGLKIVADEGNIKDRSTLLKNALNTDLKEIGQAVLNEELSKGTIAKVVLQIQKIRNVAAPKANEGSQAAPRMLKLVLTDGVSYAQAIETSTVPAISRDKTPPGTKLLLNNVKVVSGFLLINAKNCTLLGGKVPHLYEKWELAKSVQAQNRQSSTDGAPAWVNFGCKIQTSQDQQFKSLDNKTKDASKENSEFEQLRKDAIAEATTGAVRKVFGGGSVAKQAPPNIQNNNRRTGNIENRVDRADRADRTDRNGKPFRGKNAPKVEDEKPLKPSERVSLFDFLEDKLPVSEVTNDNSYIKSSNIASNTNQHSYQNNRPSNYERSKYTLSNSQQNASNRKDPSLKSDFGSSSNKSHTEHRQMRNKNQHGYTNNTSNYHEDKSRGSQQPTQYGNKAGYHQPTKDFQQNSMYDRNNQYQDGARGFQQNNFNHNIRSNVNFDDKNTIHAIQNNIAKVTNDMSKVSLSNSEFATRSLRQHLNLGVNNKKQHMEASPPCVPSNPSNQWQWNPGDECLAKYWEDGKYYGAVVTAVTEKTCVVRFTGYGNMEEVLKADCLPVTTVQQESSIREPDLENRQPYSGPGEYRRSTKTYSRRQ